LLAQRYPSRAACISTIHNGFDPDEVDAALPVRLDEQRCVLLHVGTLYGPRSPEPLLAGLALLRREAPDEARRLLAVFLGPTHHDGRPLADLVAAHGLGDLVRIMPSVPHCEALAYLKGADAAILFGQGGDSGVAPVPAKTYEYIGLGKPVLAIGAGTEALDVMRRGGCKVWTAKDSDPQGIVSALKGIMEDHARGNLKTCDNSVARLAFTRSRMAEELTSVMDQAVTEARTCR
jgi:hypothetical protein